MFAKAIRNVSRAIDHNDWAGFAARGVAKSGDAPQGFYESSFDLRSGLEVTEEPLQAMPEELEREFQRQQTS